MRLKFETATIQDAITKSANIAPTRGSALDKAAGILITVVDGSVSIRATNTEVFYHEIVDAVEVSGDGEWRLGSVVTAAFFAKMKIGSGKTVIMEDEGTAVLVKAGTAKAKLRKMQATYFPEWETFSPEHLSPVDDLKAVIDTVRWAASKESSLGVINGVFFDGQHAYATDNYRIAKFPCSVPHLQEPLTVPVSIFDTISKTLGAVDFGVDPFSNHLLLMPDEMTQIRAISYPDDFPAVAKHMDNEWPQWVNFKKSQLGDIIDMAMVFSGFNRFPELNFIIGQQQVACQMIEGENRFLDHFESPGFADHKRVYINFTPRFLLDALNAAPNDDVSLFYDVSNPMRPVKLIDGSGYEALVMPRRKGDGQDKAAEAASTEGDSA